MASISTNGVLTFAVTRPVRLDTCWPFSGDRNAGPWMSVTETEFTGEKHAANRSEDNVAADWTVKFKDGHNSDNTEVSID